MKRRQITAILLSAIMTVSACLPAGGISALAAENADTGSTETVEAEMEEDAEDEESEKSDLSEEAASEKEETLIQEESAQEDDAVPENEADAEEESISVTNVTEDIEAGQDGDKDTATSDYEDESKPLENTSDTSDDSEELFEEEKQNGTETSDSENSMDEVIESEQGQSAQYGKVYSVRLDANGGYFYGEYDDERDEYIYEEVETLVKRNNNEEYILLPYPESGDPYKRFLGWSTSKEGNVEIEKDDSGDFWYYPNCDETLYAIWGSSYTELDEEKGGSFGDGFSWSINTDGVLTIAGKGTMPDNPDRLDGVSWTNYENSIRSVVVEEGVTSISEYAFTDCKLIENVSLPNTLLEIGERAFWSCESLHSIVIPDGVTEIGREAFQGCKNLENVTLPESLDTLGVDAFRNTAWQKAMGDFPVYKGTLLRYQGKSSVVEIPEGIKNIGFFAFEDTSIIKKVILPAGVERIEDCAFSWCFGLEEISIPNTVTYIGNGAFEECWEMKSIEIPSSVTYIGDSAFDNFPESFVIFGEPGSCAEQYASRKGITFKSLEIKSILGASVAVLNQTYTGKALTPAVAVRLSNQSLVKDTDYTVSYKNNTNAGTATVTITGKGRYAGTVEKTFTIAKAAQPITAKLSAATIPVGGTATLTTTGAAGKVTSVSSNAGIASVSGTTLKGAGVGTATITVTAAETANYKAGKTSVTVKIVPAATASVKAENLAKGIKVSWAAVPGATGYDIYRNGSKLTTVNGGATVSYADKKATANGKAYTYKVVAKAATGISPLSKSVMTYCVTRPKVSSVKNTESEKATAKWKKNAKANGYELQYCLKKNFKSGVKKATIKKKATVSRVLKSLKKKKTYYVRIRTYKTVGGKKYYSAWSAAKKVKIKK